MAMQQAEIFLKWRNRNENARQHNDENGLRGGGMTVNSGH